MHCHCCESFMWRCTNSCLQQARRTGPATSTCLWLEDCGQKVVQGLGRGLATTPTWPVTAHTATTPLRAPHLPQPQACGTLCLIFGHLHSGALTKVSLPQPHSCQLHPSSNSSHTRPGTAPYSRVWRQATMRVVPFPKGSGLIPSILSAISGPPPPHTLQTSGRHPLPRRTSELHFFRCCRTHILVFYNFKIATFSQGAESRPARPSHWRE